MFCDLRFPVIAIKFPVPLKYFPVPLRREFAQKLVLYQQLTRLRLAGIGSISRNSLFFPCLTGNLPARPQRRVRLRLPAQPTSLHSHCPTFGHSPIARKPPRFPGFCAGHGWGRDRERWLSLATCGPGTPISLTAFLVVTQRRLTIEVLHQETHFSESKE